ncbi:putative hemolysin [Escherichia coli]
MRAAFWVGCAALLLSACSSEPVQQATAAHVAPGLKASMSSSREANCAMIGGSLSVARQLDGTAIGMCALPNGKRCSEQSLAAGSCGSY